MSVAVYCAPPQLSCFYCDTTVAVYAKSSPDVAARGTWRDAKLVVGGRTTDPGRDELANGVEAFVIGEPSLQRAARDAQRLRGIVETAVRGLYGFRDRARPLLGVDDAKRSEVRDTARVLCGW